MGIPTRFHDYLQKLLPHYSAGNLRWRGLVHPIDIFATGVERFAKKLGGQLPVLVADNTMRLVGNHHRLSTKLKTNFLLQWLELGGFVSIAGREISMIMDWDEDGILVDTPTQSVFRDRDLVILYSVPIKVLGTYGIGATILVVKTKHQLVIGDSLLIDAAAGNRSFLDFRITRVALQEETAGIYTWQVYLDHATERQVSDDETIQLRAYPAYVSRLLKVPTMTEYALVPPYNGVGPFLLDWVSGSLVTGQEFEEVFTYQARNVSGDPLITDTAVQGEKNTAIWRVPIPSSSMLFWDVGLGSLSYGRKYLLSGHTKHQLIIEPHSGAVDDVFAAEAFLSQDCIPPITPPAGKKAIGSIKCIPVSEILNNDYFTLHDGVIATTFEYKARDPFLPTPGSVLIDVSALTTEDEVATATAAVIVASGMNFTVTLSSAIVILENTAMGESGNQPIVDGVTSPAFITYGMADGLSGGLEWYLKVFPETKASIRVRLYPNAWQPALIDEPTEFWEVTDGEHGENIIIKLKDTDLPVTRIDIAVKTELTSEVLEDGSLRAAKLWWSDWEIRGSRVASITYSLMCRVQDEYTWATRMLMVKPYFMLLDYASARHDISSYDGALLQL